MRILIADDEKDFVETLKERIGQRGIEIDVAYDGAESIKLLKCNKYDAVFIDHNMPEMTGLEVIKYMRANGIDSKVAMITAYEEMEDFLAKHLGADEYLTKPVKMEDVERLVKLWYT